MPVLTLSPAERKAQRALAHHLHPVVLIGGDGATPAVVKELDGALAAQQHEVSILDGATTSTFIDSALAAR